MGEQKKDRVPGALHHTRCDDDDTAGCPKLTENDEDISCSTASRTSEMSSETPSIVNDSSSCSNMKAPGGDTKDDPTQQTRSSKTKHHHHSKSKPAKRKSTNKPHPKRKSTDKPLPKKDSVSKSPKRKSTDKPQKRKSTDKPHKHKPTRKPPKRHYKLDKGEGASSPISSSQVVEETAAAVVIDRKIGIPPLPAKNPKEERESPPKEEEPDYLDPNFVPETMDERRKMLIARAQKEAEEEHAMHLKRLEAARLSAQAELELQKLEVLNKLRKQREARESKEQMKAKIRRESVMNENEHFFEGVNKMNAQLIERAEEFKASLQEQEQQGLIMIRPLAETKSNQTPNRLRPKPIMPTG